MPPPQIPPDGGATVEGEMGFGSRRLRWPEQQSTGGHMPRSSLAPCGSWTRHPSSRTTATESRRDDDDEKRPRRLGDTMEMSSDERFAVLRSIGDECIYEDELRILLKDKPAPVCYVWFEPSPVMDIEQGIVKTIYVNKMVKAGCTVKILMADWFLQRHHKIGTNLNKIRTIGYYNIEMWKAAGMDLDRVELVWLSDELNHHAVSYWPLAMDISRKYAMAKIASYGLKMAAHGPQKLPAAEIFYPCMQVATILCKKLQADMWIFNMDERDVVMLARDYCEDINRETKPTIMLHNMLPSLLEDPEFQDLRHRGRTFFMLDEEDHIDSKIWSAFCPPKVAACNPCLEYIKYVTLPWFGRFEVVQKEGDGSSKTFASMEELLDDYGSGGLDVADVKLALRKAINNILEPVRDYFSCNTDALYLLEARKIENQITEDVRKIQLQNEEFHKEFHNLCQTRRKYQIAGVPEEILNSLVLTDS